LNIKAKVLEDVLITEDNKLIFEDEHRYNKLKDLNFQNLMSETVSINFEGSKKENVLDENSNIIKKLNAINGIIELMRSHE